jgi:hypothetical protein
VTVATLPTSRISGSPEGLRCGLNTRMLVIPQGLQDVRTFLSQVRSQQTPGDRVLLENPTIPQLLTTQLTFKEAPEVHFYYQNSRSCTTPWARWIQLTPSHPVSFRWILMTFYHRLKGPERGIYPVVFSDLYCLVMNWITATIMLPCQLNEERN